MRTQITIELPTGYASHECLDLITRGLHALQLAHYRQRMRDARNNARAFAQIVRVLETQSHPAMLADARRAFAHERHVHREALRDVIALPRVHDESVCTEDARACDELAQQFNAMSEAHYFAQTELIIG